MSLLYDCITIVILLKTKLTEQAFVIFLVNEILSYLKIYLIINIFRSEWLAFRVLQLRELNSTRKLTAQQISWFFAVVVTWI